MMQHIKQLRKQIDELDEQILLALSERVEICRSIGLVKEKHGISIQDFPREKDVYTHIREKATELNLDPINMEAIYRQIVNMCSNVQNSEKKSEKQDKLEN